MAVLRKAEIRESPEAELKTKLKELQQELMSERAKLASGGMPNNAGKLSEIRRTIARIYTIGKEKSYNLDV